MIRFACERMEEMLLAVVREPVLWGFLKRNSLSLMRRMAGYLRKMFLVGARPLLIYAVWLCRFRHFIFRVRIVTELAGKT